ncbi:2TM domain-containing protein [Maribacter sp. SA7]|uniref:2TM domain-containing protein n=1 Tax=Maribacter zhoushanensis TaxID=3030012 RepID=UPI0023ED7B9C|nr:2TM domain-containing protein [Maribacter zhoushanensis]MDF4202594.1 2TM domain-containing protein [Maribacter zhoushanensis]
MENTKYTKAKLRVEAIKEFYGKVASAVVTIILVAALNYYLNEWEYAWFLWVVFGLSISLFLKANKIFNLNPFMNRDWEERKLQEFLQQEENKQRWN